MNVRNLLTVNAIYVGLVVVASLLMPAAFAESNGLEVTPSVINLQRAVGGVAIGYVLVSWMMRDAPASQARRAFLMGAGIGYVLFSLIVVWNLASLPEVTSINGYVYIGLSLIMAAWFLLLARQEPQSG